MSAQSMAMKVLNCQQAMQNMVSALERAIRIEQAGMDDLKAEGKQKGDMEFDAAKDNLTEYQLAIEEAKKVMAS